MIQPKTEGEGPGAAGQGAGQPEGAGEGGGAADNAAAPGMSRNELMDIRRRLEVIKNAQTRV